SSPPLRAGAIGHDGARLSGHCVCRAESGEEPMPTIREMAARRGELKLGTFLVEFATPGIGYILKQAGCDFVLLDLEHSGITLDQLKSTLRYLEAADLPAIVGLPSRDPHQVSLALDMGARAIM